jgi:hypothetical protein
MSDNGDVPGLGPVVPSMGAGGRVRRSDVRLTLAVMAFMAVLIGLLIVVACLR